MPPPRLILSYLLAICINLTKLEEFHIKVDLNMEPRFLIHLSKRPQFTAVKRLFLIDTGNGLDNESRLAVEGRAWCQVIATLFPSLEFLVVKNLKPIRRHAIQRHADWLGQDKVRFE